MAKEKINPETDEKLRAILHPMALMAGTGGKPALEEAVAIIAKEKKAQ